MKDVQFGTPSSPDNLESGPISIKHENFNGVSEQEISHMLASLKVSKVEKMLRQTISTLLWYFAFFAAWSPVVFCGLFYALGYMAAFKALFILVSINTLTWLVWGLRLKPNFRGFFKRSLGQQSYVPLGSSASQESAQHSAQQKKCLVIGAGPVGLVATKELVAHGFDVTCLEGSKSIGGVYAYDSKSDRGCYASTKLTSSPYITAFSDFPPPNKQLIHWSCHEYVQYLHKYVQHFGFSDNIRLGHFVENVVKKDNGKYEVTAMRTSDNHRLSSEFDHVVVCSGLNQSKSHPRDETVRNFTGEIVHSAEYKDPARFAGKDVIIVGLGESGADVSAEIAAVANSAHLCTRRGTFVIPRMNPVTGLPNDFDTARFRHSTSTYIRESVMLAARNLCYFARHIEEDALLRSYFLWKAEAGPIRQTATKSDAFIYAVQKGNLGLKPAITKTQGQHVGFSDGTFLRADVIVYCTGYEPEFPCLKEISGPRDEEQTGIGAIKPNEMFRYMIHPELGTGITFLGFARPTIGSIPPIGEMQARWLCKMLSGEAELPSKEDIKYKIQEWMVKKRDMFALHYQSKAIVEYVPYLDEIAEDVGCRPNPWTMLTKPALLWKVLNGAVIPSHYRLSGPGAAPKQATESIMLLPRSFPVSDILFMLGLRLVCWPFEVCSVKKAQSMATPL